MTFEYRSRSSRGRFRSPRGGSSRGSFRGRGRGSDSYFSTNRGTPYSDRSSYRGSSYKGSNFHEREDYYESRRGGNKYGHDRYSNSHNRKDDDSYHHRDIRESSSGSFSREHSRRNDIEPDRKKIKSEIISYKGGTSPRRAYDDLEHSSRSYNSSASSYHSDSSPFKSHKKDYAEFKKPLPVEHEFSSRRPSRGTRARGGISRTISKTITRTIRPSATSSFKRIGTGRISKISAATRLQQILRRKKQLRIMRLRREREERIRDESKHEEENEMDLFEEEMADVAGDEELDNEHEIAKESKPNIDQKKIVKEIKKEPKSEPENSVVDSSKFKRKDKSSPVKGLRKEHITLKCIHCKTEYETFKVYHKHLQTYKHKKAMENLLFRLKQKLSRMRTEQREQQRTIDVQCEDFAKTSYCKLCKLNYKQTKQEHYTSDFHVNMSEFLNPRCSVCRMKFQTPILYEHHRSTLSHIKRKAYVEHKKAIKTEEPEDDENNEDEGFMVLDSVGSADESNEENENGDEEAGEKENTEVKKKVLPKIVGNEFIKKVTCYYCKLCRMCLSYNPNKNQDETLLSHCRSRYHLKKYSLDKMRNKEKDSEKEGKSETSITRDNDSVVQEHDDKFWKDEDEGTNHKLSEDEEDSKSSIRYDRFGHSDEKDNVEKQKTNIEVEATDVPKNKDIKTESKE